jgi:Uma2 family endonuclease
MTVQTQIRMSIDEFEKIAALPENADKHLEYIGGEIVEGVSTSNASEIAARIAIKIGVYIEAHQLGRVTGADGGYRVFGEDYIPDVAFISSARQPKDPNVAWNPLAPDLAVEVASPTDKPTFIADKAVNYPLAGTILWYVFPDEKQVKVYEPGQPAKTFGTDDVLDGGNALPGFKLVVKDIFPADE